MAEQLEIKKVAVIGAGLMGSGIAAQAANAGHDVVLLDIVPEGANDRNMLAKGALARMLKTKPAPLMHKRNVRRITAGNLEDDLDKLADADWICEAVLENLEIKHKVYRQIDQHRKAGSIVTSNTSTIPLQKLTEGMADGFAADFAVTHFFNPPRYMRLLEVVAGEKTRPEVVAALARFGDISMGKQVVHCKDTPGFIANRIGIYWSYVAMSEAIRLGLTVEEADAIVGQPMGIPKTGIFGLGDLTGIDLAPHVNESMLALLPSDDPFVVGFDAEGPLVTLITNMIAQGRTGRKGGGGFYRREKQDGKSVRLALDLESGEYRPQQKSTLSSARAGRKGLRALVEHPDKGGQYAWAVASKVLSYAASLIPEIAENPADIDAAMRTGYAWKWGPFEQIDLLGVGYFRDRLRADGLAVPAFLDQLGEDTIYREEGADKLVAGPTGAHQVMAVSQDAWLLADKKRGRKAIKRKSSASLWDIGDGVVCLELHAKMNAIDQDMVAMFAEAAKIDKLGFKALIIGGDSDNFSAGANLGIALFAANAAMWPLIEMTISGLQNSLMALKYAPFPVVGAVAGMTLAGGCEIALHCDAVQAHAETYMGLVEAGVGVIPAGGGCKELLLRAAANPRTPRGPMPPVMHAFEAISTAKVATSAQEARDLLYLRPGDGISMNRARLLADAKAKALSLVEGYTPPEPAVLRLPGAGGKAALDGAVAGFVAQGLVTPHDEVVADALARVLTGGDTDHTRELKEKDILAMEKQAFMALIKTTPTLDRIEHILETGRPLRN